jgi:hypothetical protein
MPSNYVKPNTVGTYNTIVDKIQHSTNKNDAIRSLKEITIQNTDVKIGEKYAHSIYNSYSKYNSTGGGRYR